MKRLLLAAFFGVVLMSPFIAEATSRSWVVADSVEENSVNHIYRVKCGVSGKALAVAYFAVQDNFSHQTKINLKVGEVAVCPLVGAYGGCYHFPSMEVALDWVRREVK